MIRQTQSCKEEKPNRDHVHLSMETTEAGAGWALVAACAFASPIGFQARPRHRHGWTLQCGLGMGRDVGSSSATASAQRWPVAALPGGLSSDSHPPGHH